MGFVKLYHNNNTTYALCPNGTCTYITIGPLCWYGTGFYPCNPTICVDVYTQANHPITLLYASKQSSVLQIVSLAWSLVYVK